MLVANFVLKIIIVFYNLLFIMFTSLLTGWK